MWIVVIVLLGSMLAVIISVPICFISFWYLYRLTKHVFCPSYIFPQHLKEVCSLPNTIKIFSVQLSASQSFSAAKPFHFILHSSFAPGCQPSGRLVDDKGQCWLLVGALKNSFCCLLLYIYCVW